jgi:5-methylthioadenosine/S-adenosylhomocysteine deaminase
MSVCPTRSVVTAALLAIAATIAVAASAPQQPSAATGRPRPESLLLEGTVVTMDDAHRVLADGRVLVHDGSIAAVWSGARVPAGVSVRGARVVSAGRRGLIFPGLIDIHDHPGFDMLGLFPPPASDRQPQLGRPTGREPYDNRYQWTQSPQYARLVANPEVALAFGDMLGLEPQVLVHAEARAALGGEVAIQGEPELSEVPAVNGLLVRDVDGQNFGADHVATQVPSVEGSAFASTAPTLLTQMQHGVVTAWIVHLAEGVRDADRAPGDTYSSRGEFAAIRQRGLLSDATVIVHGMALEPADFAAMRRARPASPTAPDDGLGAKLVWSPLSNLLLYGRTTNVYDALAKGVTVSLSTDWTASGSNTLLDELKIADVALRDPRILGRSRHEVPALAGDRALDRLIVDMVTRNPARTLHWPTGEIKPGMDADLLMIRRPADSPTGGMPDSPYRNLIDATERDVHLVLVGGAAVAGDPGVMRSLLGREIQLVGSTAGHYVKALAYSRSGVMPPPSLRLASVQRALGAALQALGGDGARPGSGLRPATATFDYLQRHWNGGLDRGMTASAFRDQVLAPQFGRVHGRLNLEAISLGPLLTDDDQFFFDIVSGLRRRDGVPADRSPPFHLYPANFNQIGRHGNPFSRRAFVDRWYSAN